MVFSPPGPTVHEISQARLLEWVATSFSRGSSGPTDPTYVSCLAGGFFTTDPSRKPTYKTQKFIIFHNFFLSNGDLFMTKKNCINTPTSSRKCLGDFPGGFVGLFYSFSGMNKCISLEMTSLLQRLSFLQKLHSFHKCIPSHFLYSKSSYKLFGVKNSSY